MGIASIVGGGLSLVSGVLGHQAAGDSADAQVSGDQAAIAEQQAAREQFFETLAPFVDIGLEAGGQLQNFLSDPTAGLEEINPVVDILRGQGFEQIQESAAAQGRLGAGGTLKDLTQFNTDLATTVAPQLQNQRFNQLFNVLGLGANAAAGQGTGILSTAGNISNLQSAIGTTRGNQAVNEANQLTNLLSSAAGIAGRAF